MESTSMDALTRLEPDPAALTVHRRSLKALTGIRFLAAFYVVIFHTRVGETLQQHGYWAAGNFFSNGYLAVPLFFLLSGFILAYTYQGQIEKPGDHRRFWEARFARIWPVYMVSLILMAVTSLSLPPVVDSLATVFMVQAWNPADPNMAATGNAVCWTLSVEALFYLIFPWFQTWIEELSPRATLGTIAAMLLLCVGINSGAHTLFAPTAAWAAHIPLPLFHVPEFLVGAGLGNDFLARLKHRHAQPQAQAISGAGAWTYLAAAASVALLCRGQGRWTSLVIVAFAALIYGLAAERTLLSRFLSTKTMLLGGGISYSVYLMQLIVKLWSRGLADRFGISSDLARMTLDVALLLAISYVLFRGVEEPARKLLRGVFARLEQRREA